LGSLLPTDPFGSSFPLWLSSAAVATSFATLARGILLGWGVAVPLGPVNVEIARRTLRGGFRAGFLLGMGAVSVDVMYAAVSSLSLARVLTAPGVSRVIGVAGVLLLIYLAAMSFVAAKRDLAADRIREAGSEDSPAGSGESISSATGDLPAGAAAAEGARVGQPPAAHKHQADRSRSAHSAYLTGVLMTLFNPMNVVFWFTVVPGQATGLGTGGGKGLWVVAAGVFLGTASWVVAFAGLLAWAGRYRRTWWIAAADATGGAILFAFAIAGFLRLIHG
jgi:L-lysine exporter family protein LysE/ArgO